MKRLLPLLLALMVLPITALFPAGQTRAQGETLVRVSPAQVTLAPGQSTTIAVWVENVEDLFGFELELRYNPQFISASGLEPGSFLELGWIVQNEINDEQGIILFDMSQKGLETESKSGSGVLIQFEITLLAETAHTDIWIEHVLLTDRDSFEINCDVQHGSVRSPGAVSVHQLYLPLVLR
ncbi:MAG: cohesin domain-containing protein [Brevefilum sp.]|jgi:hypothetical protein